MNPFRAQIWKHCLFSILMESQSLWKGKAIPFELQFYHNHWEGMGSLHQLSLRSLSIFLELSFSCSRAPLPISESQIFWERHISSFYEEPVVNYFSWSGNAFAPNFLSSTDISAVPSKTQPWQWQQGARVLCWIVPGRTHSCPSHAM